MITAKDTNTTQLQCYQCPKQFKYESERIRHEQSHYTRFACYVCLKNFTFQSALRRHEKQHERNGSVKCEECGRKFRDETLLKRHMNYAHKGTYTCEKCSVSFNSEPALCTHMKIHRPESERRFQCSFDGCGKKFNFSHHLKHHELTHTDAKQHFCKICGKGFIQSHHLKTHLKTHDPENWLFCTISNCKKKFATEYARKRHLASHKRKSDGGMSSDSTSVCGDTSEKRIDDTKETIQCSDCGDIFSQSQYKLHISKCGVHLNVNIATDNPATVIKNKIALESTHRQTDIHNASSCQTVLGHCIVDDANRTKCLCAQMSDNLLEDYNFTPIENTTIPETQFSCEGEINEKNCEEIERTLSHIKDNPDQSSCSNPRSYCEVPAMEYRIDGVIKIKDVFDIDFGNTEANAAEAEKEAISVPYNSCKAILGNCIVSGDGTIGEGCLCARMNIDEQQVMAEEIEDIIPHPNDSTMKCSVTM